MSESRQRFTGRVVIRILGLLLLWLLFVTLPLFTSYLQIVPMDPRWMTPEDLTWKRLVFNLLDKPGFRMMLVLFIGVAIDMSGRGIKSVRNWKGKPALERTSRSSFSLEWVIDGPRKSNLMEYGSFVGALS